MSQQIKPSAKKKKKKRKKGLFYQKNRKRVKTKWQNAWKRSEKSSSLGILW